MSLTGIATAEHPENVAALDNQLAVSPSEVNHKDIWPLEATGAGKVEGNTENDSEATDSGYGHKTKVTELGNDQSNLSSGKVPHDTGGI